MMKFVSFTMRSMPASRRLGVTLPSTNMFEKILDISSIKGAQPMASVLDVIQQPEYINDIKKMVDRSLYNDSNIIDLSNEDFKIETPYMPIRNVMCVGKNYKDHIAEVLAANASKSGSEAGTGATSAPEFPKYPQFFTKAPQSTIGYAETIESHSNITKWLDYEAELAVIIGKQGRDIPRDNALDYVFGYTIANDVTARDIQKRHNQWFKGKTLDKTCPLGPFVVLKEDLQQYSVDGKLDLGIKLWVNGDLRQNSRTSQMIFDVPSIIEHLSQGFTLQPGDVILTGTPHGVGFAMKPEPKVLRPGDEVKIEIEHIGELSNRVM